MLHGTDHWLAAAYGSCACTFWHKCPEMRLLESGLRGQLRSDADS
jgi:hypothetical protein